MIAITDYYSGCIIRSIHRAHLALRLLLIPVAGTVVGWIMERRSRSLAIVPVTMKKEQEIICTSRCCSAGPRFCSPLFFVSPETEGVFLDDLAGAMADAGKARKVTAEEALSVLLQYPENPHLCSKVSGRYQEICRSEPSVCIYWKMRAAGLKV